MASNYSRKSGSSASGHRSASNRNSRSSRQARGSRDVRAGQAPRLQVHQGGLAEHPGSKSARGSRSSGSRTRSRNSNGGGFRKFKAIAIVLLVLAAVLGGLYAYFYNSNHFIIKNVTVEGSERFSSEYLTQLVEVSEGSNLINVSTSTITSRLKENPWIASVHVHRKFPDTLVLDIEEQMPCAVVKIEPSTALGAVEYWLLNSDGVWMSKVSSSGVKAARQLVIDSTDEEKKAEEAAAAKKKAEEAAKEAEAKASDEAASNSTDENAADANATTSENASGTESANATTSESADSTDAANATKSEGADSTDASAEKQEEAEKDPSVCEDVYLTVAELAEYPIISGVTPGVVAQTGVVVEDEGVLNALGIVMEIDEEFSSQIATIDAATDDTTAIMLKSGIEIAFGKADDVDSKVKVIESLIEQHPDEISYINVRVVSNPIWRGL